VQHSTVQYSIVQHSRAEPHQRNTDSTKVSAQHLLLHRSRAMPIYDLCVDVCVDVCAAVCRLAECVMLWATLYLSNSGGLPLPLAAE
jgi:hypothetical protein